MMKRVIITGASGFVGSNLTRRLLQEGYDLHLFLRRGSNLWRIESILKQLHIYEVDFADKEALTGAVGRINPDWVFHLAAYGAYSWQTDFGQMIQTNIIGTINLVEACLKTGFEVFVNTGSSSEYGFKDHLVSEAECLAPNSHYAVTKASATLFCSYTAQNQKVRIPTLRLYSIYGPYEEPARLIPNLIIEGLKGRLPPLVRPEISRDFVYVADVEEAYLLAAMRPTQEFGAIYNVGSGIQFSLREVVEIACREIKISYAPEWETMPDRTWDTNVWVANNRKIRQELGWQPRHTFEEGFQKTVKWFLNTPGILSIYQQSAHKAAVKLKS